MAALSASPLVDVVRAQEHGQPRGLTAVCSANPFVLDAALAHAVDQGRPLLVEATSNQVNPEGGYTGLTPAGFAHLLRERAASAGLAPERLVLGGDHLGPHPYRSLPASRAMAAACELVRQCVAAGYGKLHLDASMRLADDPGEVPSAELVTERTAELCAAAESARTLLPAERAAPLYVIGSDVPPPGGEASETARPAVTTAAAAERDLGLARDAFRSGGLGAVWERVIGLVVQPGIDFTATRVFDYQRAAAEPLVAFVHRVPGIVLEAHSTDYQRPEALQALVDDRFGVLKVGPWLTFAFREAVLGLEAIEREWLGWRKAVAASRLREALEAAMDEDPRHWLGHHRPGDEALRAVRALGYSDRVRYYWPTPAVQEALGRLFANLRAFPPPPPLVSQHLPRQYDALRAGEIGPAPEEIVRHAVGEVLRLYARAGGELP